MKQLMEAGKNLIATTKADMRNVLETYIGNESIPLFTRWCFFLTYCADVYDVSPYIPSNKLIRNYCNEQRNWQERYMSYDWADIFEEYFYSPDENIDEDVKIEIAEDFTRLDEKVVNAIMTSQLSGYTHDW